MSVPSDARKFLMTAAKSLKNTTNPQIITEDIYSTLEMTEIQASHVMQYLADAGYITELERAGGFDYPIMFKISAKGYDWLDN